jgi:hypothetical protein
VQMKGSRLGTELFDAAQDVAEILARVSVLGHASNVANPVGCGFMRLSCKGRWQDFRYVVAYLDCACSKEAHRGQFLGRMEQIAMRSHPSELAKLSDDRLGRGHHP